MYVCTYVCMSDTFPMMPPLRETKFLLLFILRYAVTQLVEALRYKPEDRGFDSRWWLWNFPLTQSFRPHYGPGVDSASNRNENQEYFLGVKTPGVYGWQPCHFHVPTVLKSGSLKILEPPGPVQVCNGIALPFVLYFSSYVDLGACLFFVVRYEVL